MGVYSLSRFHSFTVIPMGMKPDAEFDLLSNVIYFIVFLASSYLLISFHLMTNLINLRCHSILKTHFNRVRFFMIFIRFALHCM